MGYRLVPHEVEYSRQSVPGGKLYINHLWANVALGRAWQSAGFKISLRDGNGNEVFAATDDSFDPVVMNTGEQHRYRSEFDLPDELASGAYDLRIAVVDEKTHSAIRLPIAGNDGAGSYLIGRIMIGDKAAAPAEIQTLDGGSGKGDGVFLEGNGVKLEGGHTYRVSFDYKTEVAPDQIKLNDQSHYYFGAYDRKADQWSGYYKWQDVSSNPSQRTLIVSVPPEGENRLAWGGDKAYPISISNIAVEDLGEQPFETFEKEGAMFKLQDQAERIGGSDKGVISGVASVRLKNKSKADIDALISDPSVLALKKNTLYTVSFRVKSESDVGPGGYHYLKLLSESGKSADVVGTWFELPDYGDVNKTFSFLTGDEADYRLAFGLHSLGAYTVDDIVVVEHGNGIVMQRTSATANPVNKQPEYKVEWPYKENFEAGAFNGSLYYPGDRSYGHMTNDPDKLISGKWSVWGDNYLDSDWFEYLWTDLKRLQFEPNVTYKVRFKFKIIKAPPEGGNFYFAARQQGTYDNDKGAVTWTGKPGESGVITSYATLGDGDNYFMLWGIHSGGEITIDDIVIEKIDVAKETAEAPPRSFEPLDSYKLADTVLFHRHDFAMAEQGSATYKLRGELPGMGVYSPLEATLGDEYRNKAMLISVAVVLIIAAGVACAVYVRRRKKR